MRFKIVISCLILAILSCSSPKEKAVEFDKTGFQKVELSYAENFTLERKQDQWLIHVNKPYQKAKKALPISSPIKKQKLAQRIPSMKWFTNRWIP